MNHDPNQEFSEDRFQELSDFASRSTNPSVADSDPTFSAPIEGDVEVCRRPAVVAAKASLLLVLVFFAGGIVAVTASPSFAARVGEMIPDTWLGGPEVTAKQGGCPCHSALERNSLGVSEEEFVLPDQPEQPADRHE